MVWCWDSWQLEWGDGYKITCLFATLFPSFGIVQVNEENNTCQTLGSQAGGVAQVIAHLPSKHKTHGSNPSITKAKLNQKNKKKNLWISNKCPVNIHYFPFLKASDEPSTGGSHL
jgi:hypothetical protein